MNKVKFTKEPLKSIKITKSQAKAIEELLGNDTWEREEIIENHATSDWNQYKCLNELSLEDMIRAIYVGYSVEKFEDGSWVKYKSYRGIMVVGKLKNTNEGHIVKTSMYISPQYVSEVTLERATEDEARIEWWAQQGRKDYEFRVGDIVRGAVGTGIKGEVISMNTNTNDLLIKYGKHNETEIIPVKDSRLIYRVEDRLDNKGDN